MADHELDLETLLSLEHRGWDALCRGTGGAFYGEIMTPDAVMILVNGMVLDRPTIAATLDDSPAWSTYAIGDARWIPTGTQSAALVYTATASREGQAEPFVALMASHYTLLGGCPRLALYQQSTITHEG